MAQSNENLIDPEEKLKGRHVELILRQLDSLPTLPAVATRLLGLTTSRQADTDEVVKLIQADQSLTAKLLSLASRVGSGIRKEARTIDKVVLMLGFDAVRSAVLSIKVFETFGTRNGAGDGMDRSEFWKHCLAVASAAEMIARRIRLKTDPEEVFVCGLLHDIGKLALDVCLPKSYSRALAAADAQYSNIADYERRVIGVDHTIIGRRLAQQWHFPAIIEQAIWLHHQPLEAIPDMLVSRQVIAVVQLADTLVRQQRFGYSGNYTFASTADELATQMGLHPEVLRKVVEDLPAQIEQRANLLGLGEMTSESLYRAALASANTELGRLNDHLSRRAASLAAQSRAFELLRGFGGELRADLTLTELTATIATRWGQAGGVQLTVDSPVIAYVISGSDKTVVVAVQSSSREPDMVLLERRGDFDATDPPAVGASGEAALTRAAEDIAPLGEWLGRSKLSHRPLVCAGRWVGGMLWPESRGADLAGQAGDALVMAMAFATSVIEERDKANVMAEQLGQATQQLYSTQKALTEARTLAAVGEMAAGAAHEINNPLAVVVGRAQLMAESADGPDAQTWGTIAEQAQRISDIVTEMMEFAKPSAPDPRKVAVVDLVNAAREQLAQDGAIGKVAVKVDIASNTPSAWVDPNQVGDALSAVMKNAAEATAPDSELTVEAAAEDVSGQVLIRVIDHGGGMDAQSVEKAFTPFVSSKRAGRSRGMGLSRARRYIQLAGGKVWIESRPGEGATVCMLLPTEPPGGSGGQ